jgi:PAS domain-containing protein
MIEGSADKRATLTADDDPVRLELLKQLKRSEERYHSLVENADDAVIATGRPSRCSATAGRRCWENR